MAWHVPGYRVEYLVGSGSTGQVWRARRLDDGQLVALKRIRLVDPTLLRAARAEAALLAAFDHPHIVRLHELVLLEGEAVLVLDFAEGGSLADVLERRVRLAPGEVATIVAPIAAALAAAHSEGVLHCDVSPANILFTADGRPLLADLGVARLRGQSDDVVRATPGYLDSSVAAGEAPAPHSDVFSLAAVAWRALTGREVWDSPTARESLLLAAGGVVPPVRDAAPTTPLALASAIDRALQPATHLRGSAAELALDVRHAVEPVPVDGWSGQPAGGQPRESQERESQERESQASPDGGPAHPRPAIRRGGMHRRADERSAAAGSESPASNAAGRPTFRRPDSPSGAAGPGTAGPGTAGPGTAGSDARDASRVSSGARTRAVRPRPAAAAVPRSAGDPARRVLGALGAAALIAAAASGAWWLRQSPADSSGAQPSHDPSPQTAAAGSARPDAAADSTDGPAGGDGSDPFAVWAAELARLDGIRQRAYAERDAALLSGVYAGSLLDADAAQLAAVVPERCGLFGAASQYVIDSAVATGELPAQRRVRITATATLAPGTLVCDGAEDGASAGIGPTALEIVLAPGADGMWRIAEERRT